MTSLKARNVDKGFKRRAIPEDRRTIHTTPVRLDVLPSGGEKTLMRGV
jgi:hypothetical protein